jgi:hypothetical protein
MKKLFQILIVLSLVLFAVSAIAGTVTFSWTPNTDAITGYRIYRGTAPGKEDLSKPVVDVPCKANDSSCATATDPNVPDGQVFYWVGRAYNSAGIMGPVSDEATNIGPVKMGGFKIKSITTTFIPTQ